MSMEKEIDKLQEHFDLLRGYRKDDAQRIFDLEIERDILKEQNEVLRRQFEGGQFKIEEQENEIERLKGEVLDWATNRSSDYD